MCGIYGIINRKPESFDYATFCCLGIANDSRGGDSCGIFIDGEVEYGIDKKSYFESFFWDSKLLTETHNAQIAIGHDRKASVGGVSLDKAHPILIKNNEGKIDFVLVHNGTIHNYQELAKEFIPDIDCSKLTDSQTLALILYHKGFDVLSKYHGGTAFCAVSYADEKPRVFLFQGCSKETPSSKEPFIERPLYFSYSPDTCELVFSSILSFLYVQRDNTQFMKPNVIYEYYDGVLKEGTIIDRSNCFQKKPTEPKKKVAKAEVAKVDTKVPAVAKTAGLVNFQYIVKDYANNLYKLNGELLHGKYIINDFGRVTSPDSSRKKLASGEHAIYFFKGIPLISSELFGFFMALAKKSWCSNADEFAIFYEILIRYYSYDQIFSVNGQYVIATGYETFTPFSGKLQMLGASQALLIRDGFTNWEWVRAMPYEEVYSKFYPKINPKQLWKDLKQYMRTQVNP